MATRHHKLVEPSGQKAQWAWKCSFDCRCVFCPLVFFPVAADEGEAAALKHLLEQEKQLRDRNSLLVRCAGQAVPPACLCHLCRPL